MPTFVSEPIRPADGFDTGAMARGEPGLPPAFHWHDQAYTVAECIEQWKQSGPEIGRRHGERYLRRHYFRLRMADGAVWIVYFIRRPPRGRPTSSRPGSTAASHATGPAKTRWFLQSIDEATKTE